MCTNDTNKNQSNLSLSNLIGQSSIPRLSKRRWIPAFAGMTKEKDGMAGKNRGSFTLIELLVVLALVAILSVVVVMTLNPAELLKQARDSNRLSDLSTINTALNLFSADVTSGFMGTSTVVYVSIPDNASSTCGSLGLPILPTGYTYNCVTTANLRNTNGTGWIPVNFQRISSNSPISQLPIDPQNTTSTKYYTYVTGGSWKVIATPESQKYTATAGTDGGTNIGQFEVGNNMSLAPFVDGLVGWWKFDEGSGTTAVDSSGGGNNLVISNGAWASGRNGNVFVSNGSNSQALGAGTSFLALASANGTFSSWVKTTNQSQQTIISFGGAQPRFTVQGGALTVWWSGGYGIYTDGSSANGNWHMMSISFGSGRITFYQDGAVVHSDPISTTLNNLVGPSVSQDIYVSGVMGSAIPLEGSISDARIYNRALSAAEILALYNATK